MTTSKPALKYKGPIFDAHTHSVELNFLDLQVKIGEKYGVEKALVIVHGDSPEPIRKKYPKRFVYAKYLSGWLLATDNLEGLTSQVLRLREEGFQAAKMHFAPFWRDRLIDGTNVPPINDERLDNLFGVIRDEEIPLIVHISDPDTYYFSRYANQSAYGTKDEHLKQFEERLQRTRGVQIQAAHFAAQPEPLRISNLRRLMSRFPNLHIDTGSARWMARELSREPEQSRKFIIEFADRILFGSDCVSRTDDITYYEGRYLAERLLFETKVQNVPLPFVDSDTVGRGGTKINGLDLPETVLSKLYWENANRFYFE